MNKFNNTRNQAYLVHQFNNYLKNNSFSILDEDSPRTSIRKSPNTIPKKIMLFWHDQNLPDDVTESIEKIKNFNSDYIVTLFNEETAQKYIQQNYDENLSTLFIKHCPHIIMKADLFRICYLLKEGGIYVDIDIDCYASLDSIFEYQQFSCFFLYAEGNPSCIENGFIACEPKSYVISFILTQITDHLTRKQNFTNIWEHTGPGAVTMAIMKLLFQEIAQNGNSLHLKYYLLLGKNNLINRAYHIAPLEYKNTQEGNWRNYVIPQSIYKI